MASSLGGDNNPCPGEQLHNGFPSSLQINNNILLFNWTRERQNRLGRWRLKTWVLFLLGAVWFISDLGGQVLPELLHLLQLGMK